jgi:hypothetical protein
MFNTLRAVGKDDLLTRGPGDPANDRKGTAYQHEKQGGSRSARAGASPGFLEEESRTGGATQNSKRDQG